MFLIFLLSNFFVFLSLCASDMNITEEMKGCIEKLDQGISQCSKEVVLKWKCEIGFASNNLHCRNKGKDCCLMWDVFDCHRNAAKHKCGRVLFKQLNKVMFESQIKSEEKKNCQQFKYKSKECKILHEKVKSNELKNENNGAADEPPMSEVLKTKNGMERNANPANSADIADASSASNLLSNTSVLNIAWIFIILLI